jgi:hypothetical protein
MYYIYVVNKDHDTIVLYKSQVLYNFFMSGSVLIARLSLPLVRATLRSRAFSSFFLKKSWAFGDMDD